MNTLIQLALGTAGQVAEVGEFASAALQRNIAVGVIILCVGAIAWMAITLRASSQERVKAGEQHTEAIDALHKHYEGKMTAQTSAFTAFDAAKSERISVEMKEKDVRGYDQTVKVTEAVVTVGNEMRQLTSVVRDVLAKL